MGPQPSTPTSWGPHHWCKSHQFVLTIRVFLVNKTPKTQKLLVVALGKPGEATALRGDPSSFQMLALVDVK